MANKLKFKKADMRKALIASGGVQLGAARILKCDRDTVANYINRYPDLLEDVQRARDEMIDEAELGLRDAVLLKDDWAIKYILSTLGKDRGYSQRVESTGKDGGAIEIAEQTKALAEETKSQLLRRANRD